jgi:hypothetical protein
VDGANEDNTYPSTRAVIEHNLIVPSAETGNVYYPNDLFEQIPPGGVAVQGNNVHMLLYNNTFVEPASIGGSYPLPSAIYYNSPSTAGILLRNNQYNGFGSNVYTYASGVTSPSLFEMPTDVFYATVASGSNVALPAILLWDDGASSLSWSASMGASWLTVTSGDSSSGTISGEDDSSSDTKLFLTASSTGLTTGIHSTTVTITAGGLTRVITVVFKVT